MHKIPRRQAQCTLAEVRTIAAGHAQVEQLAKPRELELVYFFLEAGFFLVADFFLGAAFLAGDFFTAFFAGDFLAAAGFLAADFFLAAAGFLAMVFLTAGFLAGDFLTGFLAADFLAAAGFCDGGSGGPTSVQVDHALTWAMRRRAHAQGCRIHTTCAGGELGRGNMRLRDERSSGPSGETTTGCPNANAIDTPPRRHGMQDAHTVQGAGCSGACECGSRRTLAGGMIESAHGERARETVSMRPCSASLLRARGAAWRDAIQGGLPLSRLIWVCVAYFSREILPRN